MVYSVAAQTKVYLQLRLPKFNMWITIDWNFHLKWRAEPTEADDMSLLMCQWNFPLDKSRYQNSGVWQNPITTGKEQIIERCMWNTNT